MAITSLDFLAVARHSLEQNGELWTRTSISRTYYAMFHEAVGLIGGAKEIPDRDENGRKIQSGMHKRLADYLCGQAAEELNIAPEDSKFLGLLLRSCHHKRITADYNLLMKVNRIDALTWLEKAEIFTEKVASCQSSSVTE